jgi:hypothetical protein
MLERMKVEKNNCTVEKSENQVMGGKRRHKKY